MKIQIFHNDEIADSKVVRCSMQKAIDQCAATAKHLNPETYVVLLLDGGDIGGQWAGEQA